MDALASGLQGERVEKSLSVLGEELKIPCPIINFIGAAPLRDLILLQSSVESGAAQGLPFFMFARFFHFSLTFLLAVVPAGAAQSLADWLPWVTFRPTLTVQSAIMSRPAAADAGIWYFQKIEAGTGPLRLDSYGITVTRAPRVGGREIKPDELVHWIRTHLADFLDPALAVPEVVGFEDRWKWESRASAAGGVVRLALPRATTAGTSCLAVTEQDASSWVFSTVRAAGADLRDWPVNGNRWIGWRSIKSAEAGEGEEAGTAARKGAVPGAAGAKTGGVPPFTFSTRGAWRLPAGTDPSQAEALVAGEEALWKSFIQRVQRFITDLGGECVPDSFADGLMTLDWEPVLANNFFPDVPWMDPEGVWGSTDSISRFRLVIHPGFRQCDFTERSSRGGELTRRVPIQPAGEEGGWKIERSSTDSEVLAFLGFDPKTIAQITAAAPGPTYLIFTRKGGVLKARWHGFIVERDGKGNVAAIKAPGAVRPKEFDFAPLAAAPKQ